MEFNWDALAAVGEILGAIGVIVTLIYLGKQIHTNTISTQGATANAILRDARELVKLPFEDRESTDLFLRGMEHFNSLDDIERAMFTNRVASFFLFWMDAFEQNQRGLISRDLWNTFDKDIPGYFAYQGFHEVWQLIRNSFPPKFQQYIDETAKLDAANSPDFLARRNLVDS